MSQNKPKIQINNRKSIFSSFNDIYHKDYDFCEVTEWTNGEGYDITISDKPVISLHESEFKLIKKLIKKLHK